MCRTGSGALSAHPETGELNVLPEEERRCLFSKLDETQNKQRDDSKVVLFILENTLRLLAGLQSKQLFLFQQTGPFFYNKFQSDGRGDVFLPATNSTLRVRRRTISAVALLQHYVCCPVMLQQRCVNDANKINHKQSSPSESCAAEMRSLKSDARGEKVLPSPSRRLTAAADKHGLGLSAAPRRSRSYSSITGWALYTCEDSVLLAGLTPADFERGVENLGETQVTDGAGNCFRDGEERRGK